MWRWFLDPFFFQAGASVTASDIEPGMIEAARQRLTEQGFSVKDGMFQIGSVEVFEKISDSSLDGLVALNVLAYLDQDEETEFYKQAQRVIRSEGFLLVSHSNRLFDMFSLNSYTVNFFKDFLISDKSYNSDLSNLLTRFDHPNGEKSKPLPIRENPLNYALKLSRYSFKEVCQEYINRHEAPPPILKNQAFCNTLSISPEDRWKLMFTCSTFASLSMRY